MPGMNMKRTVWWMVLALAACEIIQAADTANATLQAFMASRGLAVLDPNARNLRHTYVTPSEDKRTWRVQQMLIDPEEHNDWVAEFEVDLAESRRRSEPILTLRRFGSLVKV